MVRSNGCQEPLRDSDWEARCGSGVARKKVPDTFSPFIFHGSHDPSRQDSSEGCPVLDFSVRTKIGNSGIPEVEVVE
jgi:hypothetical protein